MSVMFTCIYNQKLKMQAKKKDLNFTKEFLSKSEAVTDILDSGRGQRTHSLNETNQRLFLSSLVLLNIHVVFLKQTRFRNSIVNYMFSFISYEK